MRLSQTVLTALVATSATALPVNEKQPEQQQQQVSPDHDRGQAQKFGKLEETTHKQPLGYNGDKETNTDKKNTGSFNGLFTTNGQKETQGWGKIKSALSRGSDKPGQKLDSRPPFKGEYTEGHRQHGSNSGIQARHDPSEDVRLEKPSDMGFLSHEQFEGKAPYRPFRSEYIAPQEMTKSGGNMPKDNMMMPTDESMPSQERENWMRGPSQERENWMRGGRTNGEWMRHGGENMRSKNPDQHPGMDHQFDSGRVQGQKVSREFSPLTQSWIVRFNKDAPNGDRVDRMNSGNEGIFGTAQMTNVDGFTPDQQHWEVPNPRVNENRMPPNRVPHTYEPEMRKPWNNEQQVEGQSYEYWNKGKPMNEFCDRQPNHGESKQFLSYEPTGENKKTFNHQPVSGETPEYLNYQPITGETKEYRNREPSNGPTKENLNYQPLTGETKEYRNRQPSMGEDKEFLNYQPLTGETKEDRNRQPSNGPIKENLNYQPLTGETKEYRNRQPSMGETKEFLNYQPLTGETKEYRNRQPSMGETKEFLNYQPLTGETKEYRNRQPSMGETKEFLNNLPLTGETKESFKGQQPGRPQMEWTHPTDEHPGTGNVIQRRNRHTGTQNSQVMPASEDMSHDGSRRNPSNEREYTRPHTWLVTDPSIFDNDFLEPTREPNMFQDEKLVEPRELYKSYEQGHEQPTHKDGYKLTCDLEGGVQCDTIKETGLPYEMMKTEPVRGTPQGLVDSQP
ncbi:hypothetical protein QBC39DRAFT_176618 [Podospora conica]|nr:hypothetical protein QBC39DRAFT_176618 [Schizothecium conicum]